MNEIRNKYPELKKIHYDILELIIKDKYVTQSEMGNVLNRTKNAIYRNIKKLKDLGILKREASKKGGYWEINI